MFNKFIKFLELFFKKMFTSLDVFYKYFYFDFGVKYKYVILFSLFFLISLLFYSGRWKTAGYLGILVFFGALKNTSFGAALLEKRTNKTTLLINKVWPKTYFFVSLEVLIILFYLVSLVWLVFFLDVFIATSDYFFLNPSITDPAVIKTKSILLLASEHSLGQILFFFTLSRLLFTFGSVIIVFLDTETSADLKIYNIVLSWFKFFLLAGLLFLLLYGTISFLPLFEPTFFGNVVQHLIGVGYGYDNLNSMIFDRILKKTSCYNNSEFIESQGFFKLTDFEKIKIFISINKEDLLVQLDKKDLITLGLS